MRREARSFRAESFNISHRDPHRLLNGYALDGTQSGSQPDRLAFFAPVAASLRVLPQQPKASRVWHKAVVAVLFGAQAYSNETLQVLTLLYR